MYTWTNKWVQLLESRSCTKWKFRYTNSLNKQSYYDLSTSITAAIEPHSTLLVDQIEVSAIKTIIEEPPYEEWLKAILGVFYNSKTSARFFSSNIRVCSECYSNLYHSYIHQLIFIEKCPIHNTQLVPLYNPNNISGIDYEFQNTYSISILDVFNNWESNFNPLKITLEKEFYSKKQHPYKLLYYDFFKVENYKDISRFTMKENDFKRALALTESDFFSNGHRLMFDESQYWDKDKNIDDKTFEDIISTNFCSIFEKMFVSLRTRDVLINLNCLEQEEHLAKLAILVRKETITCETYAFILWAKEFSKHKKISRLTKGNLEMIKNITPESIKSSSIYQYIIYEWKLYQEETADIVDQRIFIEILNLIVNRMLSIYYNNCLKKSESIFDNLKNKRSVNIRYNEFEMPLFILWKQDKYEHYVYEI